MKPQLKIVQTDAPEMAKAGLHCQNLTVRCPDHVLLSNLTLDLPARGVTALIGPSGAGKSTFLRTLNRIDETGELTRSGHVELLGRDILAETHLTELRRQVGMVFQSPTVFPSSVGENVLFGIKGAELRRLSKIKKAELVQDCLERAALWDELKNRLDEPAHKLSLGQQQRLSIARTLAVKPKTLLLDEPTASIDPKSALIIEALARDFAKTGLVIMATHNLAQARRVADYLIFLCEGKLVEYGPAKTMFSARADKQTRTYLGEEYCDC